MFVCNLSWRFHVLLLKRETHIERDRVGRGEEIDFLHYFFLPIFSCQKIALLFPWTIFSFDEDINQCFIFINSINSSICFLRECFCTVTDLCVLLIVAVNNLPETIHIKYMPGKPEIFLLKENLNNR